MSITNAEGVRFAQSVGVDRVTLARELSLDEVRAIRAETDCALEIFVHGALCVAYSGQCFSSEAWGGRSANRGQCAQACRLPYRPDGGWRDCAAWPTRAICFRRAICTRSNKFRRSSRSGVAALKIEGRYKDADYVALTTRAYRKAVDEAWAGRRVDDVARGEKLQLEQVYSRGLGPFFLTGTNHQAVVNGRAPRHRGVLMGRVARVDADRVVIEAGEAHRIAPLKAGDGVVFDAADWRSPEEPEEGGRVYEVSTSRATAPGAALRQWRDSIRSHPRRAIWSGARTIRISIAPRGRLLDRRGAGCAAARCRCASSRRKASRWSRNGRWRSGPESRSTVKSAGAAEPRAESRRSRLEVVARAIRPAGKYAVRTGGADARNRRLAVRARVAAESVAARGGGEAAGSAGRMRLAEIRRSAIAMRRNPPARSPRQASAQPNCICWSARPSSWMPRSICGPPASRSIISISTACGLRSSA